MLADPFVGRRVELDVLKRAIDSATTGRGSIVLVAGEPGIGKSRLAAVAAGHAREMGATVRRATCWEEPGAPFRLWAQLLRGADASAPADVRRLAGETVPDDDRSGLGGDAEPVRVALFDTVSRYLIDEASEAPLLLVLDDLHWADVPSLRLLAYLARLLGDAALVVVGTFRDVEVDRDSDVGRALEAVASGAEVIRLEGLRTGEVAELLAASAGALAPTDFAREVHARTGGNPLFVRELSRLLAAPGRQPDDIASLPVPEGVHGVIRRRLARLSQRASELLARAAVFGPAFRADLLASAADASKDVVLDLLDVAVDARLVVLEDAALGRYAFAHALVRDVLYSAIPSSRRAAMHLEAAEAIERSAPADDHLAELAFHHTQGSLAGSVAQAIEYSVRAGRRALEQLAYEDAAAHFDRALRAQERAPDDDRRTEILLELGDARLRAGDMPGARHIFEEAADLARRRNRADDLARAALGFGAGLAGFEVQLFDERQIELIDDALRALPPVDSPLRAALLARLSVALTMQESVERRRAAAEDAVAMSRRVGDDRTLAYALSAHCDAIAGPADAERRLGSSDEIIRIARSIGDRSLELLGRRLRVVALLEIGDMRAVDREIEQYAAVADIHRQPLYSWYVALWRGLRALMRGEFDAALGFAAEAEAIGARAHSTNAPMLASVQRWFTFAYTGRYADARAAAQTMVALMPGWGNPYFDLFDAWMDSADGDVDKGRAAFRRMPDPVGDWLAHDSEWLVSMCQLAYAVALLDERDVAPELYERMLPHRGRFGIEGIAAASHGSIEHHLGLLARTAGRVDDAVLHFEAALRANRAIGARHLEARSMAELASSLALRATDADTARAATLRSQALSIADDLGLGHDALPLGDAAPVARVATPASERFVREGDFWTIVFAGDAVRVKDVKGLHDLARLVARPGAEVAAIDLVIERGDTRTTTSAVGLAAPGHAGELLDEEAKASYKARLAELEREIEDADSMSDPVRGERAREERDALVRELQSAYGLGRRPRRAGDPTERARTTVTRRIRDAIARISDVHPALGRHLQNSVKTGSYCSYAPEQPVDWEL